MNDINIELVENGVIVRVYKGDRSETFVFPSLEDAQEWLKQNVPNNEGLIESET